MQLKAFGDGGIVSVARTRARVDDDIHCGQLVLMLPERFPNEALDAIATDRDTDHFGSDG